MITKIQNLIQQMPPLLFGFVVIVAVLIGFRFYDPPKTLCDVQAEAVQKRLANGFYRSLGNNKNSQAASLEEVQRNSDDFSRSSLESSVIEAFNFCLSSNSPGGCFDMFSRLDFFEKQIRTIPTECGESLATEPLRKASEKALRLFLRLAWGEEAPKNKYNITSWLDTHDLGIYCRLKREYVRLFGKKQLNALAWSQIPTLPGAKDLTRKEMGERSLMSYPCKGLY